MTVKVERKIDGKTYRRIKAFDYGDKRTATSLANRLRSKGTYKSVRVMLSSPESKYFGKVWIVWARV